MGRIWPRITPVLKGLSPEVEARMRISLYESHMAFLYGIPYSEVLALRQAREIAELKARIDKLEQN